MEKFQKNIPVRPMMNPSLIITPKVRRFSKNDIF